MFHRLGFIIIPRVKGVSYELNYSYQLRRVLEVFGIKLVELLKDDVENLRLESLEDYLIRKGIESCQ